MQNIKGAIYIIGSSSPAKLEIVSGEMVKISVAPWLNSLFLSIILNQLDIAGKIVAASDIIRNINPESLSCDRPSNIRPLSKIFFFINMTIPFATFKAQNGMKLFFSPWALFYLYNNIEDAVTLQSTWR
jgi:hypothetical protein